MCMHWCLRLMVPTLATHSLHPPPTSLENRPKSTSPRRWKNLLASCKLSGIFAFINLLDALELASNRQASPETPISVAFRIPYGIFSGS